MFSVGTLLGPVYTKCQHQRCDNSVMTLVILFSLKSVESLENRLQPHSGVTPFFSMRTESQASSLSCHSIDADAWCKWALRPCDVTMFEYHYNLLEFDLKVIVTP